MLTFQNKLVQIYGPVSFPNPQFLNGDNTNPNLANCVNALLHGNTSYDIFAVAGSTGVDALKQAGATKIVQVVGGNSAYDVGKKITGYHIDAGGVAGKQVKALRKHCPGIDNLTVLYDSTSDTSNAALSGARNEAANKPVIKVNAVLARNPAEVHALTTNQVKGMFMLCPSGMYYDAAPMQDIITLVAGANVPAIFPEIDFTTGTAWYVLGHNVPKTYEKAAHLAKDLLNGTLTQGGEAQDKDDNT
jgi:hypothetical protein